MTVGPGRPSEKDYDDLVQRTLSLVQLIEARDDVSPAFESVQSGIENFERSADAAIDVLLPSEAAAAGFLRVRSPRAFVLALICSDKRAREEVRIAINTGPAAVVGTVVSLLTVGVGFAIVLSAVSAIVVGIAALLITRGLDGACAEASR
jgi:hypothetical protein